MLINYIQNFLFHFVDNLMERKTDHFHSLVSVLNHKFVENKKCLFFSFAYYCKLRFIWFRRHVCLQSYAERRGIRNTYVTERGEILGGASNARISFDVYQKPTTVGAHSQLSPPFVSPRTGRERREKCFHT